MTERAQKGQERTDLEKDIQSSTPTVQVRLNQALKGPQLGQTDRSKENVQVNSVPGLKNNLMKLQGLFNTKTAKMFKSTFDTRPTHN